MAKHKGGGAQIYQFPLPLEPFSPTVEARNPGEPLFKPIGAGLKTAPTEVVISGSYRKDNEGLRNVYQELQDLGCRILSPSNVHIVSEADGFVFMEGEQRELPANIELRHLNAIQEAQFVWLHAPEGYVGLSAALEVGFAHAIGIPVYSRIAVTDPILGTFVERVDTPQEILDDVHRQSSRKIPRPAVQAFQKYYKRAAVQRGYGDESARDTLLLMVEEVGELARAIRKKEKLRRHGRAIREDEALELADVFIYVIHLANVLGVNLSEVVKQKELLNIEKLIRHPAAK
jgi:NTP pyrophosphatase (non-canonical NTP hydrolase)